DQRHHFTGAPQATVGNPILVVTHTLRLHQANRVLRTPAAPPARTPGVGSGPRGRQPRNAGHGGPSQGRYIQTTRSPMATTIVPAASEVPSEARTNEAFRSEEHTSELQSR